MNRLRLIILGLLILIPLSNLSSGAPPDIIDVEGTIYELDGITPIWRSVNISLKNLNTSDEVSGVTNKANPAYFKISLGGSIGDTALLKVWNRVSQNNKTIALDAVRNESITLNMTFPNYAPEFYSSPITTATEDTQYTYAIDVEDYNHDQMTLTIEQGPLLMGINGKTISWTPTQADVETKTYFISIKASDGALFAYRNFTINVSNVNDAPAITSYPTISGRETDAYTYQVNADDEDNDTLTYNLISGPSNMTLGSTTGIISWNPQIGDEGKYLVKFNVTDGAAALEQEYILFVGPASNNDPVISSTPAGDVNLGSPYTYNIAAADTDGDSVIYELFESPEEAYIIDSTVYWTPGSSDSGTEHLFVVRAIDSNKGSDFQVFYVNVTNITAASSENVGGSRKQSTITDLIIPAATPAFAEIEGVKVGEDKEGSVYKFDIFNEHLERIELKLEEKNIVLILKFRMMNGKPAGIISPPSRIYRYYEIELKDSFFEIMESKIYFAVEKGFYEEINLTSSDVIMRRYANGTWQNLETFLVGNEDNYSHFYAISPGFSYFAVGLKQGNVYPQTSYLIDTPKIDGSSFIELKGTVYGKGRFQVESFTSISIINNETKEVFDGITGIYDRKNTGSFYSRVRANINDTLVIYVHSEKHNITHKQSFIVTNTTMMEISIFTNIPTGRPAKIIILVLFVTAMGALLLIWWSKQRKSRKKHVFG